MYICCRSKERIKIYFRIGRSTKRFVIFSFIYFVLTYVLYMCMFPACCFHKVHTFYICVCFQLFAFIREHICHKALLMGYSMRLELTLVSSLNAGKQEFRSASTGLKEAL